MHANHTDKLFQEVTIRSGCCLIIFVKFCQYLEFWDSMLFSWRAMALAGTVIWCYLSLEALSGGSSHIVHITMHTLQLFAWKFPQQQFIKVQENMRQVCKYDGKRWRRQRATGQHLSKPNTINVKCHLTHCCLQQSDFYWMTIPAQWGENNIFVWQIAKKTCVVLMARASASRGSA